MQETGAPEASRVKLRSLEDAQALASAGLASRPASVTTKSAPPPSPPSKPGGILGELGSDPRARLKPPASSPDNPRSAPATPVKNPLFNQAALKPAAAGLISARSLGPPLPPRPGSAASLADAKAGLKPAPKPPPPPPPPPPAGSSKPAVGGHGAGTPQVAPAAR